MKTTITITTLSFTFLLATFNLVVAQPTIQWQKSLGGSNNEEAFSVEQTSDSGYIVVGASDSNDGDVTGNNGGFDYWLIKLDANGSIQWQKNYGGSGDELPFTVKQTYDKGYIVAGKTSSNDGDVTANNGGPDYWVVKLDSLGNIKWEKSLGGSGSDWGWDVQQTTDSGYVFVGESKSNDGNVTGNHGFDDYWVVKTDSIGNLQWQKSLGGSQSDKAYSIQQTNDLGYIVVGESTSNDGDLTGNNGGSDYWIVKLDSIGTIEWQKNYGGSSQDVAFAVQQTQDKGYIVAGYSESNDGDVTGHHGGSADDYWILKLDSLGNLIWQKSLGGTFVDQATDIKQVNDGGYVVFGTVASSDGDVSANYGGWDYWLVKIDSIGNLIWEQNYGGSFNDIGFRFNLTNDNGFVISGGSNSIDNDISGNNGMDDFWIVKLNPVTGIDELDKENGLISYPNPTSGNFYIEIKNANSIIRVYTILGKQVLDERLEQGKNGIDLNFLSNGVYLIKVSDGNHFYTNKIIINH